MNIVLAECHERIYSKTAGVESHSLGLFLVRGDNVAIIGEIDNDIEGVIDYNQVKANPLNPMHIH